MQRNRNKAVGQLACRDLLSKRTIQQFAERTGMVKPASELGACDEKVDGIFVDQGSNDPVDTLRLNRTLGTAIRARIRGQRRTAALAGIS